MNWLGGLLAGGLTSLTDVANAQDRRAEREAEIERRRLEIEEQRRIRERERAEDKAWQDNRDAMYRKQQGLLAGDGSGNATGSGSGGGKGVGNAAEYAVYDLMEKGLTRAQALAAIAGQNPFRQEKIVAGDLPDGSDAEVSSTPDDGKFRQIMSGHSTNMKRYLEGANADNIAKGEQTRQMTNYGQAAELGTIRGMPNVVAAAGVGARVTRGEPLKDDTRGGGLFGVMDGSYTQTPEATASIEKDGKTPDPKESPEAKDARKFRADALENDVKDARSALASVKADNARALQIGNDKDPRKVAALKAVADAEKAYEDAKKARDKFISGVGNSGQTGNPGAGSRPGFRIVGSSPP